MSITITGVTRRFGSFTALSGVDLQVPSGSLTALLGPSGSGKTTLLRIIAGLESADAGQVLFDGRDVTHLPARERGVGFVFQHYALFRHMTVAENIAFGLRVRKAARAEVTSRVQELLRLVRLEGLGQRLPAELSGGQRQRVALARALAVRPQMLLLDEPFGALDARVRQELRGWLRRLHQEMHVTTVFVTHDQEEAFEMADQVVVMNQGQIEQTGSPQQVFDHPATSFVMDFLGNVNVFHGRVTAGRLVAGPLNMEYAGYMRDEPREATAYVRPHELELDRQPGQGALSATVLQVTPAGALMRVRLLPEGYGVELQVDLVRERAEQLQLIAGDRVSVRPKTARVFMPEPEYII